MTQTAPKTASSLSGPIMVTGSAGFIGRHLVRTLLDAGHDVTGLDRKPSGIAHPRFAEVAVDILDRERLARAVAAARPALVVHLAARTDLDEGDDLRGYDANVAGVRNMVDAIAAAGSVRRWICASTQLVCRIGYVPTGPDDYLPSTLYGESKVRTERIVRAADGGGVEWCLVRPTTIWGPGMNPHYLTFFRMIRDGRYFHLSGGPTYKSYGYVGNTVHQLVQLLGVHTDRIHRGVFYLADYEPLALEEWAEAFRRVLGAPRIRTLPLPVATAVAKLGDVVNRLGIRRFPFNSFRLGNVRTSYRVDLAATEALCGPLPYTTDQGVSETVAWLRTQWTTPAAA
jgi:nucleoside-diphosphate-sugar epimerase